MKTFIYFFLLLFPLEAFVSGMVGVTSVSDFVFLEYRVGMKIQKSESNGAYKESERRLGEAREAARTLATRIMRLLKELKKANAEIEFTPINEGYDFFKKSMVGYEKFPTLTSDEEAHRPVGKASYFELSEEPRVVVHFKKLPKLDTLNKIKTEVNAVLK